MIIPPGGGLGKTINMQVVKQIIIVIILAVIFQSVFIEKIFAQSSYVLPYPSYMPGSMFYKLHRGWESISKYWFFGNFSQFVYNLKLSDKYLVEAKTLFEYKQYLLAYKALIVSNKYFDQSFLFLKNAKEEGKNIVQKEVLFKEAAQKHIEILEKIKQSVPEIFIWAPEKEKETSLFLWKQIDSSINTRDRYL